MTFDEAVEILQKQIDMGEKKVGDGEEWCARAHTTHAYQMILDEANRARTYEEFLRKAINEIHTDHYGDAALAYSIICDMLSEVEKQMENKTRF